MGKDDFLTAKAIGKRIKAKGLQKLRWFCQMCEKQCRDENGFKCHINSEAHQRQMLLFNENATKMVTGFSEDFQKGFLETLSSRYGTRRVLANSVYQDYIANRTHIHMNATCWSTLTGFCKYLGREGLCVVEETEQGWYLTWIDRSSHASSSSSSLTSSLPWMPPLKKKQLTRQLHSNPDDPMHFTPLPSSPSTPSLSLKNTPTSSVPTTHLVRSHLDPPLSMVVTPKRKVPLIATAQMKPTKKKPSLAKLMKGSSTSSTSTVSSTSSFTHPPPPPPPRLSSALESFMHAQQQRRLLNPPSLSTIKPTLSSSNSSTVTSTTSLSSSSK